MDKRENHKTKEIFEKHSEENGKTRGQCRRRCEVEEEGKKELKRRRRSDGSGEEVEKEEEGQEEEEDAVEK